MVLLAAAAAMALPAGVRVEVDLPAENLAGMPFEIAVTLHNEGDLQLQVPDLDAERWRLRVWTDGNTEHGVGEVRAGPPRLRELPPGRSVTTRLRLVTLGARPTRHHAVVRLYEDSTPVVLAEGAISFVLPRLSHVEFTPMGRTAAASVWTHDAAGDDLVVVDTTDTTNGGRALQRVAMVPHGVRPALTVAPPGPALLRPVVWIEARQLHIAVPADDGTFHVRERVVVPWPDAALGGSPVAPPEGGLLVPIWVPAPRGGSGGQLQFLELGRGLQPSWRASGRWSAAPQVTAGIDAEGRATFVLRDGDAIRVVRLPREQAPGLPARDVGDATVPGLLGVVQAHDPDGLGPFVAVRRDGDLVDSLVLDPGTAAAGAPGPATRVADEVVAFSAGMVGPPAVVWRQDGELALGMGEDAILLTPAGSPLSHTPIAVEVVGGAVVLRHWVEHGVRAGVVPLSE